MRFIDAEATMDSGTERQIDGDNGRPDGYNRKAELAAMKEEEVKNSDTTQVTELK